MYWPGMGKSPLLLALFLAYFLLLILLNQTAATSINFNYDKFIGTAVDENLILEGDAIPEKGMLNLTSYKKDSTGRVRHKSLLQLWDKNAQTLTSFTTRFTFIINNALDNKSNGKGDGITFFLAHPDFQLPLHPDGSGIGLVTREQLKTDPNYAQEYPFVAVEFDTFPNVDLGDPDHDHVGIDVKRMWTSYTTEWYTMNDGRVYETGITYNSSSNQLVVDFLGFKDNVSVQQKYAHEINLSSYLPEQVQFGFSSATGLQFEIHTLCSWSFDSTLVGEGGKGKRGGLHRTGVLLAAIGGSIGVVVLGVLAVLYLKGKRYGSLRMYGEMDGVSLDAEFESVGPRKFPYHELVRATDNFAERNKLGEGGFGGVYKGRLTRRRGGSNNNACVAIKKVSQESKQGVKEYASEVKIIGRLSHRNLVRLFGWCHESNNLLLVYEFMENGSLDSHLFGNNNKNKNNKKRNHLTWPARHRIAQGLAAAILYLHEECEQRVVHRDIKPSNIMLDSNLNTKLGDFGLARFTRQGRDLATTTAVAGTKGYMAPEYLATGRATGESDVYSFGVVALELACGQKSILPVPVGDDEENSCTMLVEWVWGMYGRGEILGAADRRLMLFEEDNNGDDDDDQQQQQQQQQQLQRLMVLGLWCAHPDHTMRPTIRQALNVLSNNEAPLPILPPTMPVPAYVSPSFSEIASSSSSAAAASSSASSSNPSSLCVVSSAAMGQAGDNHQRPHTLHHHPHTPPLLHQQRNTR